MEGKGKFDYLVFTGGSEEKEENRSNYSKFCNKIRIPKGEVKEAKYEDGLLTVRIDTVREQPAEPPRKQISIA